MNVSATQTASPYDAAGARPVTRTSHLARVLDLDFLRLWPAVLLAGVYAGTRLPWIRLGYGADPDAWRVAMSARYLLQHGSYLPSRLPGYPVHDIAMALLLWGGWTLTNLATVAASLAGVFCFAAAARRLRLPQQGLLTVTFAFLPLLWSTSVQTLDYSWALALLTAAYLSALYRRAPLAGLLLGLAGGCRVTYLVFALPLALYIWRDGQIKPVLRLLGATAATWLLVFSPVSTRYGAAFWNFYDLRPGWSDVVHSLTESSIGLMPLLVIAACLAFSIRELRTLPALLRRDANIATCAMIVILALFIFVRLPLQTYYLMPAAPFALIMLGRLLRPRLVVIICAALLLGGFIDIYTTAEGGWRSLEAPLSVRPTPGLVLQDYRLRRDRLALVRQVPDLPLAAHSVLTAGFYFPMVMELHHTQLKLTLPDGYLEQIGPLTDNARAVDSRDVTYVWLLPPGDARRFLLQGYELYSLDFSRERGVPAEVRIYRLENERFGLH